jgi:hypothetical protein
MRIAVTALTHAHGGAVELRTTSVVASSMRGEPWTSSSVPLQSLAGDERTSSSPASSSQGGRQRAVRRRHRGTDLPALPRRQPRPGRDLVTNLGERPTRAQQFATYEAALTDPQPKRHTAMRQVLQRADGTVLHPRRHHPTGRTTTLHSDALHQHHAPTIRVQRDVQNPEPGSANSNVFSLSIMARGALQLTALGTDSMSRPRASDHSAATLKYQAALPG